MSERNTRKYTSDVAIIGAGIAGLVAAIRLKEEKPALDVLAIDRQVAGTSGGKANRGGGVLWIMQPNKDDPDKLLEYHTEMIGDYLNDQDVFPKVCNSTFRVAQDMERWGVQICKEPDGTYASIPEFPLWSLCGFDHNIMDKLRAYALKVGVRLESKIQVVELLTSGKRVIGAAGFDTINGDYCVFSAKSVIMATGGCDYMVAKMWSSARGDGIAAAYRAGAELRDCEYGNFYNIANEKNDDNYVGPWFAIFNNKGERIAEKYCFDFEPDVNIDLLLGMEKEIAEGNGPLRLQPRDMLYKNPFLAGMVGKFHNRPTTDLFRSFGKHLAKFQPEKDPMPVVIPRFLGEFSSLRVDGDMKSSLEGLWGIGDTCFVGSAWAGAVPAPPGRIRGAGLMYASVSAEMCVDSVAEYASTAALVEPCEKQLAAMEEIIYAPLGREGKNPREIIGELKEIVAPPRYSTRKSAERLEEALGVTEKIIGEAIHEAASPDGDLHILGLCHDARNMATCAKLYFTASLARKESRGFHYREDYPERDDKNYMKWSIQRLEDGKEVLEYEDIPYEHYKYKPEDHPKQRHFHP